MVVFLMIRRPPRSTRKESSAASDVYKRQLNLYIILAVNFKTKKDTGPRINEQITASEVRLISSTGKQMGIISIREALIQAEDEGFDLVEVFSEDSVGLFFYSAYLLCISLRHL